jgi:glycosyltransferase involved in cell wall biosynthesis
MPERFTFLLESTAISGTARLVMAHADARENARIVTADAPVTWRSSRAEWVYVDELRSYRAAEGETIVPIEGLPWIVDEELYRASTPREHEPLRVLLAGSSHIERHGLHEGYGAVAHARWFHQKLDLVRVSPWAPSREEPLDSVQEFHVALSTSEMTRLMHSCDVLLVPSRREDPLPLVAAEGLAAGLACVFTAIPSLTFDERRDYALFAPEDNAVELGERLIDVLSDEDLRERLRGRGRAVAAQWLLSSRAG